MNSRALKFFDLDAFLLEMEKQGLGPKAHDLIYERDKEPYRSAFLIPLDLLPDKFDQSRIKHFGGTVTHVQRINYLGTEVFYSDFMIYPVSLTGYLEVENHSDLTFAASTDKEPDMIYVINLEDGGSQEFYLGTSGEMIGLDDPRNEEPQEFKSYKLVAKQLEELKGKYAATCRLYFMERNEFAQRRIDELQKRLPGDS